MECSGENFFQLQGRKTATLKFGLFDQFFFSFLPKVVALVSTVIFSEKKTKPSHVQIGSQGDGFLEDFLAVRPET